MSLLDRLRRREPRPPAGTPYDGPRARFNERERVRWPGVYAVDEHDNPTRLLEWQPDPEHEGEGRWVFGD